MLLDAAATVCIEKMCYCHWRLNHSSLLRVNNVLGIDLVRHLVIDYVGMNNWEHVHSFSGVCKPVSYTHLTLPTKA